MVCLFTFSHKCTHTSTKFKAGALISFCNLAYLELFSIPEHCFCYISVMEITDFLFICQTMENNPLLDWQSYSVATFTAAFKAIQSNVFILVQNQLFKLKIKGKLHPQILPSHSAYLNTYVTLWLRSVWHGRSTETRGRLTDHRSV